MTSDMASKRRCIMHGKSILLAEIAGSRVQNQLFESKNQFLSQILSFLIQKHEIIKPEILIG